MSHRRILALAAPALFLAACTGGQVPQRSVTPIAQPRLAPSTDPPRSPEPATGASLSPVATIGSNIRLLQLCNGRALVALYDYRELSLRVGLAELNQDGSLNLRHEQAQGIDPKDFVGAGGFPVKHNTWCVGDTELWTTTTGFAGGTGSRWYVRRGSSAWKSIPSRNEQDDVSVVPWTAGTVIAAWSGYSQAGGKVISSESGYSQPAGQLPSEDGGLEWRSGVIGLSVKEGGSLQGVRYPKLPPGRRMLAAGAAPTGDVFMIWGMPAALAHFRPGEPTPVSTIDLDAFDRESVRDMHVFGPTDIYWVEASREAVRAMHFDGTGVRQTAQTPDGPIQSLVRMPPHIVAGVKGSRRIFAAIPKGAESTWRELATVDKEPDELQTATVGASFFLAAGNKLLRAGTEQTEVRPMPTARQVLQYHDLDVAPQFDAACREPFLEIGAPPGNESSDVLRPKLVKILEALPAAINAAPSAKDSIKWDLIEFGAPAKDGVRRFGVRLSSSYGGTGFSVSAVQRALASMPWVKLQEQCRSPLPDMVTPLARPKAPPKKQK